jgi:hypothetical protein
MIMAKTLRRAITDENIEMAAKIAHQAIVAYSAAQNEHRDPWAALTDEAKQAAIKGVKAVIENREATAEEHHNKWLSIMAKIGYTLGPILDAKAKRHPALLPWDMLGAYHKGKGNMFVAIVRAFFGIEPEPATVDKASE